MSKTSNKNSGCLGLFLQMLGLSGSATGPLPFRLRDDFLSPAEISFYHVLMSATDRRLTVCPKVNLNDLFFVSRPDKNTGAQNRISRKHIDFLLCDKDSMRPRAGIELDDSSHTRKDRQSRDSLVQAVFDAAGLPLLRFPVQRGYNVSEIASLLSPFFAEATVPPSVLATSDTSYAPQCPKCGIPLVIRSGSRGKFYGCGNYPKCRETLAIS